jgi:hypothetical protein
VPGRLGEQLTAPKMPVLAPITAAGLLLYQRRVLGMPLERLKDGWLALLERLLR